MKQQITKFAAIALVAAFASCNSANDRYLDLQTGKAIEVEKDNSTGYMVNKETREPVYIYVDTKKNDTIYGKTGLVINGHVVKGDDDSYMYDEDEKVKRDESGAVKYKDGDDYKIEVEKDGDVKIKDGDSKTKIDGKTGERKDKKDD